MKEYKEGLDDLLLFLNFIKLDSCIMTNSEAGEFSSIEIINHRCEILHAVKNTNIFIKRFAIHTLSLCLEPFSISEEIHMYIFGKK